MTTIELKEQYMLRVRRNSELDRMMTSMMSAKEPLTYEQIAEIGGKTRSPHFLRILSESIDNMRLVHKRGEDDRLTTLNYIDVNPGAPVAIGIEAATTTTDSESPTSPPAVWVKGKPEKKEEAITGMNIRWPQAPPLINSMGELYRKPSWFDMMAAMVDNGRHVALAGPPGVGKDTAVQELAAQEGKILVTVSGDAGFRRKDLVGSVQIASGRSFMEVAEYAAAVVHGWWVLLTEVNAADADALLFINSQLAPPYIINIAGKAYPVHPNFRLFVSYNPGLVGTKPLPQAFKDRFFSIQVPFFTAYQMKNVLISHGAPDNVTWVDEIVKFGMSMWQAHERGAIRYQVTSRRLMDAVELMKNDIVTSVPEAISLGVIASIDSPIESNTARQLLNNM